MGRCCRTARAVNGPARATDERQRKMVYSKQETTGAPTCCRVTCW
jgi:hypothetical protein